MLRLCPVELLCYSFSRLLFNFHLIWLTAVPMIFEQLPETLYESILTLMKKQCSSHSFHLPFFIIIIDLLFHYLSLDISCPGWFKRKLNAPLPLFNVCHHLSSGCEFTAPTLQVLEKLMDYYTRKYPILRSGLQPACFICLSRPRIHPSHAHINCSLSYLFSINV